MITVMVVAFAYTQRDNDSECLSGAQRKICLGAVPYWPRINDIPSNKGVSMATAAFAPRYWGY